MPRRAQIHRAVSTLIARVQMDVKRPSTVLLMVASVFPFPYGIKRLVRANDLLHRSKRVRQRLTDPKSRNLRPQDLSNLGT